MVTGKGSCELLIEFQMVDDLYHMSVPLVNSYTHRVFVSESSTLTLVGVAHQEFWLSTILTQFACHNIIILKPRYFQCLTADINGVAIERWYLHIPNGSTIPTGRLPELVYNRR